MWRTIGAGLFVSTCLLGGCGNKDSDTGTAPPPQPPALPDSVTPHPTTQQLEARVKLDLKYDPITMAVPSSWVLKSMGENMVVLEGATPTDTIGFSIPPAWTMTSTTNVPASLRLTSLETEAKADAAKLPDIVKTDVVHDITGARVVELFTVDSAAPTTQGTAEEANQNLRWVITICVPNGKNITAYELRTVLPVKTYKTDHAFLRSIVNSIACYQAAEPAIK